MTFFRPTQGTAAQTILQPSQGKVPSTLVVARLDSAVRVPFLDDVERRQRRLRALNIQRRQSGAPVGEPLHSHPRDLRTFHQIHLQAPPVFVVIALVKLLVLLLFSCRGKRYFLRPSSCSPVRERSEPTDTATSQAYRCANLIAP